MLALSSAAFGGFGLWACRSGALTVRGTSGPIRPNATLGLVVLARSAVFAISLHLRETKDARTL